MRKCLGCGKTKANHCFSHGKGKGIRSRCRECRVKETAEWRIKTGKRWASPLTNRIQIIKSHLCHVGSTLRSKDVRKLYEQQNGKCAYSGIQMLVDPRVKMHPLQISIDRIDSNKGYIHSNVVLCCLGMNHLKGPHTTDIMYDALKQLYNGTIQKGEYVKDTGAIQKQ